MLYAPDAPEIIEQEVDHGKVTAIFRLSDGRNFAYLDSTSLSGFMRELQKEIIAAKVRLDSVRLRFRSNDISVSNLILSVFTEKRHVCRYIFVVKRTVGAPGAESRDYWVIGGGDRDPVCRPGEVPVVSLKAVPFLLPELTPQDVESREVPLSHPCLLVT